MTDTQNPAEGVAIVLVRLQEQLGFITSQLDTLSKQVTDRQDKLELHLDKLQTAADVKHTDIEHRLSSLEKWQAKAYGVAGVLVTTLGGSGWYIALHTHK